MQKAQTVLEFYALTSTLKDVIRKGWKNWRVQRERLESVAEHVYKTQMLAFVMWSQYGYNHIDIFKVIMMIAFHELEETIIGDMTQWDIAAEEKQLRGHEAVAKILSNLVNGDLIKNLIYEFDERKTPEAKFAYWCDKLECDLQSCLYDSEKCVEISQCSDAGVLADPCVQELLQSGVSWSEMWCEFGRRKYDYDQNFTEVSLYASSQSSVTRATASALPT